MLKEYWVWVLILLAAALIFENCYIFAANRWEVKEYTNQTLIVPECPQIPPKTEIYKLVRKEFNSWCLYFECDDLGEGVNGRACPQINAVFIEKGLDELNYTMVLAHEISHCKFKSINECYTEFKAITTLYESDNEFLHYIGVYWANEILSGQKGGWEYDCGYYLDKYLKGE